MSIRFYTTDVDAEQTAAEIQQKLAQSDARRVMFSYAEEGSVQRLEFTLEVNGQPLGFRLEPDVEGMKKALNEDEDTPGSFDRGQARRVAWRLHKEWVNAVLAFRDARQASMDQLLLGFGVTPDGATVYERLVDDQKLLTEGR
jgi:hypothetical protein